MKLSFSSFIPFLVLVGRNTLTSADDDHIRRRVQGGHCQGRHDRCLDYYYCCDHNLGCINGYCGGPPPTEAPTQSPAPSPAPTNAPVVITSDDFEDGLGNFALSGRAQRVEQGDPDANDIPDGSGALRIRKDGYVYLMDDKDVANFTNLQVSFKFHAVGMERQQGFALQYSSDSGVSWTRIKRFKRGTDFRDGGNVRDVTIDFNDEIGQGSYKLTDSARIRFKCHGDEMNDRVYIDDVVFEGIY